jgi:hypothetical protein
LVSCQKNMDETPNSKSDWSEEESSIQYHVRTVGVS